MNGTITVRGQKIELFNNNLCQEILLTDLQQCTLGLTAMKKIKQYQFSRARWYEAKLPRDAQGAFNWCVENFGPEPKNPDAWSRWYFNVERRFRFRDEQDYAWFVLRWGA